jgi:membrane-bound lytic murein transglycosylase B
VTLDRALGTAVGVVLVTAAVLVGIAVTVAYGGAGARGEQPPTTEVGPTAVATVGTGGPTEVGAGPRARDPHQPDATWLATTAGATGIPARALAAYARAHLQVAAEQPGCKVAWNTIAALGGIESLHGTTGGSVLGADGWPRPAIRGPALNGGKFGAIRDTDGGALDGDATWDRAVGPLQFIPSTWERWAADGNGDGDADPDQVDDAALAAGRYLCHSGDLTDAATWRRAIFSYNHSDAYVADIAALANTYAQRAG